MVIDHLTLIQGCLLVVVGFLFGLGFGVAQKLLALI